MQDSYTGKKALPIGVDLFTEMLKVEPLPRYYYVDKTELIFELINNGDKANLITRPRRFGKSLNLDMLSRFFSRDSDPSLFNGLKISQHKDLCSEHQGKYPVLYIDLKSVCGKNFDKASFKLCQQMQEIARPLSYLASSPELDVDDKNNYDTILHLNRIPRSTPKEQDEFLALLEDAPFVLTEVLKKHFHQQVVVLIDEYDVPLNDAYFNGYYDDMLDLIREMFKKLLKRNTNLAIAVITGCLQVSHESIFIGMNSLNVWDGNNSFVGDYFGFTEDEVKDMLEYYGLSDKLSIIRDWYDGYCFGKQHLYCPWDVLKFMSQCLNDGPGEPENYWVNTSGNDILKMLLSRSDKAVQQDYTAVMSGKTISKTITNKLTYRDLSTQGSKALWSIMVASGYLTVISKTGDKCELAAPNREVRWLLSESLQGWLCSKFKVSDNNIEDFCVAVEQGKTAAAETSLREILTPMLEEYTQHRDKQRREDLYQGILLGILRQMWMVRAEVESGDGYVDISFQSTDEQGFVMELKDAADGTLEQACKEALDQIRRKRYTRTLMSQGCTTVLCYGIAFKKGDCKIVKKRQSRRSV